MCNYLLLMYLSYIKIGSQKAGHIIHPLIHVSLSLSLFLVLDFSTLSPLVRHVLVLLVTMAVFLAAAAADFSGPVSGLSTLSQTLESFLENATLRFLLFAGVCNGGLAVPFFPRAGGGPFRPSGVS